MVDVRLQKEPVFGEIRKSLFEPFCLPAGCSDKRSALGLPKHKAIPKNSDFLSQLTKTLISANVYGILLVNSSLVSEEEE
jgi:hypothetical protein